MLDDGDEWTATRAPTRRCEMGRPPNSEDGPVGEPENAVLSSFCSSSRGSGLMATRAAAERRAFP